MVLKAPFCCHKEHDPELGDRGRMEAGRRVKAVSMVQVRTRMLATELGDVVHWDFWVYDTWFCRTKILTQV